MGRALAYALHMTEPILPGILVNTHQSPYPPQNGKRGDPGLGRLGPSRRFISLPNPRYLLGRTT
jgi:hypothetical protein